MAPRFGADVVLRPVSGTVRITLPGAAGPVRLTAARQVPLQTVIDTRAGVVQLTAALPQPGRRSVGVFNAGVFEVRQARGAGGLVDLVVRDTVSATHGCRNGRVSPFQLGLLLGSAHSGFRTDGEFASAAVLGTKWGVRNRCDGTLTIDREGTVVVTVFHPHRTIVLHTGQRFLARAH